MRTKLFFLTLMLLLVCQLVTALPQIDILSPNADQENNQLVRVEVNVTDWLYGLDELTYSWDGNPHALVNNHPEYVNMTFGKHTLIISALNSNNERVNATRTFNVGLNVENGKAIMFGLVSVMFLLLAMAFAFSNDRWFLKNGFISLALVVALVVATTGRKFLSYQYSDVDTIPVVSVISNVFIILLLLFLLYFTFITFVQILKYFIAAAKGRANAK